MEIKSQTTTTTLNPTTELAVAPSSQNFFGTSVGITVGRLSGGELATTLANSYLHNSFLPRPGLNVSFTTTTQLNLT